MLGHVVLGTVKGDIHEIGKSLVGTMLSANGFEVYDLGIDIESSEFVAKAREYNADIVALSALLTTTMLQQRDVIEHLAEAGRHAGLGRPDRSRWLCRGRGQCRGGSQEADGSLDRTNVNSRGAPGHGLGKSVTHAYGTGA